MHTEPENICCLDMSRYRLVYSYNVRLLLLTQGGI